jgi:hypothetical protein
VSRNERRSRFYNGLFVFETPRTISSDSGIPGLLCFNEQSQGVELELVKLADEVRTIHENLLYLRDR